MKNKFYKHLFQILCTGGAFLFVLILIIIALVIIQEPKYVFIMSFSVSVYIILFFIGTFYWIFQKVIIDQNGIKIVFFKKIIKQCTWAEIESIEESNFLNNPTYYIQIKNGKAFYLDKRKSIKKTIEFYSKKII